MRLDLDEPPPWYIILQHYLDLLALCAEEVVKNPVRDEAAAFLSGEFLDADIC